MREDLNVKNEQVVQSDLSLPPLKECRIVLIGFCSSFLQQFDCLFASLKASGEQAKAEESREREALKVRQASIDFHYLVTVHIHRFDGAFNFLLSPSLWSILLSPLPPVSFSF